MGYKHIIDSNKLLQFLRSKCAAYLLLVLYCLCGLFIVKDYGVSTDEPIERNTSLITYKYVMEKALQNSNSEAVRNFYEQTPSFMSYPDRFYGTALHFPLVLAEHIFNFELSSQMIYLMRHIYNFLNYLLAAFCFYLILYRRYGMTNSIIPFLGLLLFIIYPRFFAEAFYNNKDILFYSWYTISVYTVFRWLEKPSLSNTLLAGATLAISTNTRILGISVLLLGITFSLVNCIRTRKPSIEIFKIQAKLVVIFFVFFTLITPYTWSNPIKGFIDIFFHFLHYNPWNGTHMYLGEMITRDVPWHYIIVWLGVTSPVLYIVLFLAGVSIFFFKVYKKIISHKETGKYAENENLDISFYDSFYIMLFFCSLGGFIILKINMYTGWRHAYFIFASFLYISIYGLYNIFLLMRSNSLHRHIRRVLLVGLGIYIFSIAIWLGYNHPYQYAYFNLIASPFAESNFLIDYWHLSHNDLIKYILKNDSREKISANGHITNFKLLLDEKSSPRIIVSSREDSPDYIMFSSRNPIPSKLSGYHEIYDIRVNGYKIAALFKRVESDGK